MSKKVLWIIVVLAITVLITTFTFTGCKKESAETTAAETIVEETAEEATTEATTETTSDLKSGYKIAVVFPGVHDWYTNAGEGMKKAAEEIGAELEIVSAQNWKQNEQNEMIDAAVAKGYKLFAIAAADISAANAKITELKNMGCNVINFSSPIDYPSDVDADFVANTPEEGVKITLGTIYRLIGGKGNIAVVEDSIVDPNIRTRAELIDKIMKEGKEYPGMTMLQNLTEASDPQEGAVKVANLFSSIGDQLDGICSNGWYPSVSIANYITNNKVEIKASLLNFDPVVLKAVQDGWVDCTICDTPYVQGYLTIYTLAYLADGYKFTYPDPYWFCGQLEIGKEQAGSFIESLDADARKQLEELKKYFTK